MDPLYLAVALLLVLVNAFFAMAEYSLVRIRASRLEELVRQGRGSARLIRYAVERIDGYLSAVQLGITMTSLGLGWVGEPAVGRLLQRLIPVLAPQASAGLSYSISFTLAFLLITATHILFGELVPKLTAIGNPERAAAFTIYPMTGFYFLSFLPMQLLRRAANGLLALFGARAAGWTEAHSEDEIRILLEEREEEGGLSLQRLLMFENLFDFGRARAGEVMTPRGSIAYLSRARRWQDNLAIMMQRKSSRYPVCRGDLDSVEGYVHIKDLAFECLTRAKEPDLLSLRRPILYFREDTPLEECLRQMQYNRVGLAVVLTGRKKVAGLLSLEDLLEEIVGEIRDEFENAPRVRLSTAFVPQAVDLNVEAADRFELLQRAVERLHAARPIFDRQDALEQVYQREKRLGSALGHETAFPHARIQGLAEPLFTFLRCPGGVDLNAPDGKPVRLGFLILTPHHEPAAQVQLLSHLARLILNTPLRMRLLEASEPQEVAEVIGAFESTIPL